MRCRFAITLRVGDGRGGSDEQQFVLTVLDQVPNRPPVFTSTPIVDANVNTLYIYPSAATDPDGDTLTFSIVSGPDGMTIDADTGRVHWTPSPSQLGINDVLLQVFDGHDGIATQPYRILVQQEKGNHAPMIISDPVLTAVAGSPYQYDVNALDPDQDTLTYTLISTPPSGLSIDPQTGVVSWTPPVGTTGSFPIQVRVEDGRGGMDSQNFQVIVSPPGLAQIRGTKFHDFDGNGFQFSVPPAEVPPVELTETGDGSIQMSNDSTHVVVRGGLANNGLVPYDGFFRYTDLAAGEETTWSTDPLLRFPDGSVVVLSNQSAGGFGAPIQIGNDVVRNSAVAAGVNVVADTELVGRTARTAFTFTGESLDGITFVFYAENDLFGFTNDTANYFGFVGSTAAGDLKLFQYDSADGGLTVLMTAETGPGASLDLFGAGVWTGWGSALESGDLSVLSADGSNFSTSGDIGLAFGFTLSGSYAQLVVNYNGEPEPPEPGIPDWIIYLDQNQNQVRDPEEQYTTTDAFGNYAFTNLAPGTYYVAEEQQPGWVQTAPAAPASPFYVVELGENEVANGKDFANVFTLNTPPELNVVADQMVDAGQLLSFAITGTDVETPANQLQYSLVGAVPAGAAITSSGQFTWTPSQEQGPRTYKLTVRVNDDGTPNLPTLSDTQSFFVTVLGGTLPENENPVFSSLAPNRAIVGQRLRYDAIATDPNNDALVFDLPVRPSGMVVDPNSGVVVWTPAPDEVGVKDVLLRVRDGRGGVALQSFQVTVAQANVAPVITSDAPTLAFGGHLYQYQVQAQDADGDVLVYRLDQAPSGMTISSTGLISWTPPTDVATFVYPEPVFVRVSDRLGGEDTQFYSLMPLPPNQTPTITSQPTGQPVVDLAYQYQVVAQDADGDTLSYFLDPSAPEGVNLNSSSGLLTWTPTVAQTGEHTIVLYVSDGRGGVADQALPFTVTSTGVNDPPTIDSQPLGPAQVNVAYRYQVVASDANGDPLTFSLDTAPAGMTISSVGVVSWSPNLADAGTHSVSILVADGRGGAVSQSFDLVVGLPNSAPVVTATTPPGPAVVDEPYQYQIVASDPDGDPLTFELIAPIDGMAINATGLFTWTPQSD